MGGAVDSGAPPSTMVVVVVVFCFLLLLPTTVVSGDGEETPLSFSLWNSSEYALSPLTDALSKMGFTHFAMASHYMLWNSPSPPPLAFHSPVTVFAPSDAYVARCISCSLTLLLQAHTIPGLYPVFSLLSAAEIQTVIPGRCLTVSSSVNSSGNGFFIGAAQITHPNLFVSDHVIIHGLRGLVSPHSCSLTSLSPSLPFSIPHVSLSTRTRFTSSGHGTVLVVTLDGILSLVEIESQTILWSINTGQQIYSAYHDPEISNETYVDCGEDWILYRFDRHRNVIERLKSAKELISHTTQLSENGITVVGQMGTTVILVEAETGKISEYRVGSGLALGEKLIVLADVSTVDISITRTDYTFIAYDTLSNIIWNLSISEFESNSETREQVVRFRDESKLGDVGLLPSSNRSVGHWSLLCGAVALVVVICCISMKRFMPAPKGQIPRANSSKNRKRKKKNVRASPKQEFEASSRLESVEDSPKQESVANSSNQIGKIWISSNLIALGSNGTAIYEGSYEMQRPVAVKRFVRELYNVAEKEISNLVRSDQSANVVRYYGMERDANFIYLALEKCHCTLMDLIEFKSGEFHVPLTYTETVLRDIEVDDDLNLWKSNSFPSSELRKLMRDIVSGVAHLHKQKFIHRDLKPQNILLIKNEELSAKIADMGVSKRIVEGKSSITCTGGRGSSGWQAPEQLCGDQGTRRETLGVDLFMLGLLIFYCLTKGKHPFGEASEQDSRIKKNEKDLFCVEDIPEAVDLLTALLDPNPELRPPADEVLCHPLFWNSETRLSFIRDASNQLEKEREEVGNTSNMLNDIRLIKAVVFGKKKRWSYKINHRLITYPKHGYVKEYDTHSVIDLVRLIRNTCVHYDQLESTVQELLGARFEVDTYYRMKFPHLLIELHNVIKKYCKGEDLFKRYFR